MLPHLASLPWHIIGPTLGAFVGALAAPRLNVWAIVRIMDRRLSAIGCPRLPSSREPITAPVNQK